MTVAMYQIRKHHSTIRPTDNLARYRTARALFRQRFDHGERGLPDGFVQHLGVLHAAFEPARDLLARRENDARREELAVERALELRHQRRMGPRDLAAVIPAA